MEIKEVKLVETSSNFDPDDEINVEVAKDEADKMFSILLENYKNARSAFIRELTSNAWDAHKEANIDKPVQITISKDDSGDFVEVKDFGYGMSKEFIKKTFSQLLKSTKNNTNQFIGGWGIGSKSPLAYQDQFTLTTIHEGLKNEYLIYKEGTGLPKILPIRTDEPTDEHSGTTVKVNLKNESHREGYYLTITEAEHFVTLCVKELSFFDNVWINSKVRTYTAEDYNYGKIVEGESFVYRSNLQYSSEMHIVLGKVCYPIDWKELGLDCISIPIGIKFDIGDLMVNMTRETIKYSDEAKELIKERIEKAKKELISLYNSKNVPINGLFEFIKAKKVFETTSVYKLDLTDDISVNITELKEYLNGVEYAPIKHLNVKLTRGISPIFMFRYSSKYVSDSRIKRCYLSVNSDNNHDCKTFINYYSEPTKEFRQYVRNALFLREEKITHKPNYRRMCEYLGIPYNSGQVGVGKKVLEYTRIIRQELYKELNVIDYNTFEIPDSWKKEQKEELKRKTKRVLLEGVMSVKDFSDLERKDIKLSTFDNFTGILIVGFKEDTEALTILRNFFRSRENYNIHQYGYNVLNNKAIRIYQISKANAKHFLKVNFKVYHTSQFMELEVIQRFLTAVEIDNNENIKNLNFNVALYSREISSKIKKLKLYLEENAYDEKNVVSELLEIYKLGDNQFKFSIDPEMKELLNEVNNYFEDVELLRYADINKQNVKYAVKYLKEHKKKTNLEFYNYTPTKLVDSMKKEEPFKPLIESFGLVEQPFVDLKSEQAQLPKIINFNIKNNEFNENVQSDVNNITSEGSKSIEESEQRPNGQSTNFECESIAS